MAQKCVHKACGKVFTDPDEPCLYHPGPPEFHEGQKGWKCCKPRVLTFDEFMQISPCTTGKHSTVDDTPVTAAPITQEEVPQAPKPVAETDTSSRVPQPVPQAAHEAPPPEPESSSDDISIPVAPGTTCRRRGCGIQATADTASSRDGESCIYHPGVALFHEGSKGWTCCKRRVLEFDEFLKITGCQKKDRHLFVGSGKKGGKEGAGEKKLTTVRHDFYQTPAAVHASLYLKKIKPVGPESSSVEFTSPTTLEVDLPTADNTRYKAAIPLYGKIDVEKSSYKILGTKLELELVKADGLSWPVLRADEPRTGEIIQVGKPGRA